MSHSGFDREPDDIEVLMCRHASLFLPPGCDCGNLQRNMLMRIQFSMSNARLNRIRLFARPDA